MKRLQMLLALMFCSSSFAARADEVSVAVAANFAGTFQRLAIEFENKTEHKITVSVGSSGKFYAQIKNGAPFQVFLSADEEKPAALEQDHLAVPGSRFTYAVGRLALWSAKADLLDGSAKALLDGKYRKLAIANPTLAPYGAAAVDVLTTLGIAEKTRPHWVQGENIAQTYQFIESGNADIGFVALAQIMQEGKISKGSAWIIPQDQHKPIRQDAVLLRKGEKSQAAKDLLEFLQSKPARILIEADGYIVPANDKSL